MRNIKDLQNKITMIQQPAEISLFGLFTRPEMHLLESTAAAFVLLPVIAFSLCIKGILAIIDLYKSPNRHIGKVADTFVATVVAIMVAVSVTGFFAAHIAFAIAGPALFIASLGLVAIYNLSLAAWGAFNSFERFNDSPYEREIYRGKLKTQMLNAIVATSIVIAVIGLMLIPFALPVMAVIGGVTATVIAFDWTLRIKKWISPETTHKTQEKVKSDLGDVSLLPKNAKSYEAKRPTNYLRRINYRKHRDDVVKHFNDTEAARGYLLNEITEQQNQTKVGSSQQMFLTDLKEKLETP